MKKLAYILFSCFVSCSTIPKEYHVDCSNSSDGDGSVDNPFKTIAQAANIMLEGDVCYIHKGCYRESLIPKNSGTESKPITFTAYGNDTVIISAAEIVSNWEQHSGNIYKKAGVSMPLGDGNNVYWGQEKMQLARWPNDLDNNEYSLDAKYIDMTTGTYSLSCISNDEIPDIDWTGGIIHYLGAHSGCSWERTISSFDRALHRVYFKTLPEYWPFGTTHHPNRLENGHRGMFYLMNKLEALDAPREWYYDANNQELYFYAPDGNSPDNSTVEIAVRRNTVELNRNYIHLDRLNFFGGMISIRGSHNTISNCMVKHGIERIITDLDGATMEDAAIQVLKGHHNIIEKCILESGTLNGIYLSEYTEDNRVENCIVQYFNTIGLHVHLIRSEGARNRFVRNSLYGSARDGVKITGNDSEFGYNHVQKCLISGADGGLFYVTGRSIPRNIELHHNWFHDAHADTHAGYKAAGIYLDNNSAGYIVHHNVVWNTEWGGLNFNWNALENEIYNNTFWNIGIPEQSVINSWVPKRNKKQTNVRDNKLYNNLTDVRPWWHSGAGTEYRVDENEYKGPQADNDFQYNEQFDEMPFSSEGNQVFMPYPGSPVIDKGRVIEGITDGYKGEAPDLGAYEFGDEYWIPGVDWTPEGFAWTPGTDYQISNSIFNSSLVNNPSSD